MARAHVRTTAPPASTARVVGTMPAARIAVTEAKKFLEKNDTVEQVSLVCFGRLAYEIHLAAVKEILG